MNIFKKIKDLAGGGLLQGVGNIIDEFITTDEEHAQAKQRLQALRQAHEEKLQSLANEDRHSARDMQKAALAQDDTLSKRFVYYLAALWSVAGIAYVFLVTFWDVASERTSDTVLGFLMGTIVSTIINYFFGASENTNSKIIE